MSSVDIERLERPIDHLMASPSISSQLLLPIAHQSSCPCKKPVILVFFFLLCDVSEVDEYCKRGAELRKEIASIRHFPSLLQLHFRSGCFI